MNKTDIVKVVKAAREKSEKRNFKQSFDLILNLKDIDLKKTENQIDLFLQLPFGRGRETKICALTGIEMKEAAKDACDVIVDTEFAQYDKKKAKKLAETYDFFIAQANLMGKIAGAFGKVFGPRNKMPNPKAGCVVLPNANVKQVVDKLSKMIRMTARTQLIIQVQIGSETMKDDEVAENVTVAYNSLANVLPNGINNIKSAVLKLTMGKIVKFNDKGEIHGN